MSVCMLSLTCEVPEHLQSPKPETTAAAKRMQFGRPRKPTKLYVRRKILRLDLIEPKKLSYFVLVKFFSRCALASREKIKSSHCLRDVSSILVRTFYSVILSSRNFSFGKHALFQKALFQKKR